MWNLHLSIYRTTLSAPCSAWTHRAIDRSYYFPHRPWCPPISFENWNLHLSVPPTNPRWPAAAECAPIHSELNTIRPSSPRRRAGVAGTTSRRRQATGHTRRNASPRQGPVARRAHQKADRGERGKPRHLQLCLISGISGIGGRGDRTLSSSHAGVKHLPSGRPWRADPQRRPSAGPMLLRLARHRSNVKPIWITPVVWFRLRIHFLHVIPMLGHRYRFRASVGQPVFCLYSLFWEPVFREVVSLHHGSSTGRLGIPAEDCQKTGDCQKGKEQVGEATRQTP